MDPQQFPGCGEAHIRLVRALAFLCLDNRDLLRWYRCLNVKVEVYFVRHTYMQAAKKIANISEQRGGRAFEFSCPPIRWRKSSCIGNACTSYSSNTLCSPTLGHQTWGEGKRFCAPFLGEKLRKIWEEAAPPLTSLSRRHIGTSRRSDERPSAPSIPSRILPPG